MKSWTDDFLNQCLDGLPKDKYRNRAKAELEDHLLTLTTELESSGLSTEDAQVRALALMGDSGELNRSFQAAWIRRASNWRYCLGVILKAAVHGVLFNILCRWFFVFPFIALIPGPAYQWVQADPVLPALLFSLLGFLPGLWFTSREMNERFSIHPRGKILVLLGLLAVWLLDGSPVMFMSGLSFDSFLSLFFIVMILSQYSTLLLIFNSTQAYWFYCLMSLALCLLVSLFYHPRNNRTFILSDTD